MLSAFEREASAPEFFCMREAGQLASESVQQTQGQGDCPLFSPHHSCNSLKEEAEGPSLNIQCVTSQGTFCRYLTEGRGKDCKASMPVTHGALGWVSR